MRIVYAVLGLAALLLGSMAGIAAVDSFRFEQVTMGIMQAIQAILLLGLGIVGCCLSLEPRNRHD